MNMELPVDMSAAEWDAFMLAHGGGFLQSWGWYRFQRYAKRSALRDRWTAAQTGELIGLGTEIVLPLPFGQKYLYVPHGPVFRAEIAPNHAAVLTTEQLRSRMRETGAAFARLEIGASEAESAAFAAALRERGFRPGTSMQPVHTVVNDLTGDEAAQLAAMHHKTRYNIRVAERHGVTVRETVYESPWYEADAAKFHLLLSKTAARDGFSLHERQYYSAQFATLHPGAEGEAQGPLHAGAAKLRLWFAEKDGMPLAAAVTMEFGDAVTYLHGASDHASRQLMAPYLLHWKIMQASKAAGFKKYDFWGVAPPDADDDHPWSGITRFKLGFGGSRLTRGGAWELPGNRFWYTLYRSIKRFRR